MVFKVTVSFDNETRTHFIESDTILFGRSEEADVLCPHKGISRNHLEVFAKGNQIYIQDLGTSNGTRLGGSAVSAEAAVPYQPGTPIQLGTCEDAVFIELLIPSQKAVTSEDVIKKAKAEADAYWEQIRNQAQDTRIKAEESAEELVKQAHLKIVQDQEAAQRKAQTILEKAQEQALEKITAAETSAQSMLKTAEDKAVALAKNAADRAAQEFNQLKERYKAESEKYWSKLVAEAQEKARALFEQQVQEKEREWQSKKDQELSQLRESLRTQLESEMEQQRAKAEEQLRVKNQEAEKKLSEFSHQLKALQSEKTELEKSLTSMRNEAQDIETQVQRYRTEMSHLKIEVESLEKNRSQITDSLKQVEKSKQELDREVAQLQLELRNRKLSAEEEFHKIHSDLERRKQLLQEEILQLSNAKEKTQAEVESQLTEQTRETEARLKEMNAQLAYEKAELEKIQAEVQQLQAERQLKVKSMESVMEEFLNQEKKLERLHGEFEKHKSVLIHQAQSEATRIREQAHAEKRRALSVFESEIAEKRARLEMEIDEMRQAAASQFKISNLWPFSRKSSQKKSLESPQPNATLDFDEKTPIVQIKDLDLSDTREINEDQDWEEDTQITEQLEEDQQGSAVSEMAPRPTRKRFRGAVALLLVGLAAFAAYNGLPSLTKLAAPSLTQSGESHFRDTYTENLLYTDRFFERYTSKSFQDGWLISVHSYLAEEFGFSRSEVARLIAIEVQLIKELKEILDSTSPEEAEAVMMAKEMESSQAMKDLFTSENAFVGFKDFQKQYYDEFFRVRSPANAPNAE